MTSTRFATVCGCILGLVSLSAQTPQQQRPPVFRSDANFVQVDAYPMKDGKLVTNLEQKDFEILEDGKPQKIEAFELIKVQPFTPDSQKRDPNTQEEGNELAADPKNRVFVVYLDHLNVSVEGAYRTRQPLVQMLNRVLAENDLFGVATPDMRARDLVFGRKVGTTEDMLTRYWPWGTRGSILKTRGEEDLQSCTVDSNGRPIFVTEGVAQRRMIDILIERQHEDKTLTNLEDLIDYLGAVRETRKSLIVFTEGWILFEPDQNLLIPLQGIRDIPAVGSRGGQLTIGSSTYDGSRAGCIVEVQRLARLTDRSRFRDLVERARLANVVFFPVNPLGLTSFDYSISQPIYMDPKAYAQQPGASVLVQDHNRLRDREDALLVAANNTGGLAVLNTNNLNEGLDRIANQLSAYYVMGYYSTNAKFDGRYRKIDVKMKVPGVSVTARKGYRAPTEAEMAARNAPKPVVAPSVAAAIDENAAALGGLARIRPNSDLYGWGVQTSASDVTVFAEVSPQLAESGKWMEGGDLQVVLTSPTGEQVGTGRGRLDRISRGASARVAIPAGAAGPWSAQLRVRSGADMIETTVAIPKTAVPSATTLLSAPLLYRATPGMNSALHPVADFLFRRTERVHIEWSTGATLETREARLLDRAGNPLPVLVTLGEKPGVLVADINLAPLGPGDYIVELTVSAGGQTSHTKLAIRVQN